MSKTNMEQEINKNITPQGELPFMDILTETTESRSNIIIRGGSLEECYSYFKKIKEYIK